MNRTRKRVLSVLMLACFLGTSALATQIETMDISMISETNIEPKWSYMYKIGNGLDINQYEITVAASTLAYGNNHAYVTAVLQQKQANGSYEDYVTFDNDGIGAAVVSEDMTVPYGTYRIVSYHSAGNGTNMEYKSLVGPDKRVPHDTGK